MDDENEMPDAVDDYDMRKKDTAAVRLAYLLHEHGVIGEFALSEFLYPGHERIEQAEQEQIP